MKFSIIVPIYNIEKYIGECIDSLVNQTLKDYEIILVNDGSTDGSPKIIDAYANRFNNIVVLHKENGGLSSTRNAGVSISRGDYIVFVDGDDFWNDNEALEKIYQKIIVEKCDVVVINQMSYYGEEIKILKYKEHESNDIIQMIRKGIFGVSAWMRIVKKDLFINNNLMFLDGYSEDLDWTARVILFSNKISYLNTPPIYFYRKCRQNSITSTFNKKNLIGYENALQRIEEYYKTLTPLLGVEKKDAYLNYWATIYVDLFSLYWKIEDSSDRKRVKRLLKKYYWLRKYDASSPVHKLRVLSRLFTFNVILHAKIFQNKIRNRFRGKSKKN